MPNWVFNGLTIEGKPESVKNLMAQMNKPFIQLHESWNMESGQMEKKNTLYPEPIFAFHNIYSHQDAGISDELYNSQPVHNPDKSFADFMKFDTNDWYNFNCREWGVKWDVAVASGEEYPNTTMEDAVNGENHVVHYNFETAWSRPLPALFKLSSQYPDLLFTHSYEEETGWGGEMEILNGIAISESEYDNMCNNCEGTYTDEELTDCEDCGDFPCPKCGWSNDMCETHQKTYEEKHA